MDPFSDVLPSYILGAPFLPFLICTIAAGMVAVGVMGKGDSLITFAGCAVVGWIAAILFRGTVSLVRSVNWVSLGTIAMWVFCILLAVVVVIVTLGVAADHLDKAPFRNDGIALFSTPGTTQSLKRSWFRVTKMYHGTKHLEWAKDIVINNRWRIGSSGDVYLTNVTRIAAGYTDGGNGAIVEVGVSPKASLVRLDENVYHTNLKDTVPGKYYRLKGLIPRRILDSTGKVQIYP